MKPTVYIETSIVSYLTAWPSKDPVQRGIQVATERWWKTRAGDFALYTSQLVIDEASAGDPSAATDRLSALAELALVDLSPEAIDLAGRLVAGHALPEKAVVDATHLAIAATNEIDFLVTWNCKHLANAVLRAKIEEVCDDEGFRAPRICTPLELMEVPDGT